MIYDIINTLPDHLDCFDCERLSRELRKPHEVENGCITVLYDDTSSITFKIIRIIYPDYIDIEYVEVEK